ncbi:uncharacterized protein LOC133197509 [Saccostrea echinata]|uniref:uncharacterized protein LOC133197509 n=1 Tax=Saccostrea echinata TaxID=191078 RepID=UPI002A81EC87|nr:uncharacterized protein LOC133197509 [Saccostrea echinata]
MEGVQKCGYLEVKEPSCIKGRKLKTWKRKWAVMQEMSNLASGTLAAKLDFFLNEASSKTNPPSADKQTYLLENVTAVEPCSSKTHKLAFQIVQTTPTLVLCAQTQKETEQWILAFKQIFLPNQRITEEDGFPVTVVTNDDAKRCNIQGEYLMVVSPEVISIEGTNGQTGMEWRLDCLKRFHMDTSRQHILFIESGAKASCGEAKFEFQTTLVHAILQAIKTNINKAIEMRKRRSCQSQESRDRTMSMERGFHNILSNSGQRSRASSSAESNKSVPSPVTNSPTLSLKSALERTACWQEKNENFSRLRCNSLTLGSNVSEERSEENSHSHTRSLSLHVQSDKKSPHQYDILTLTDKSKLEIKPEIVAKVCVATEDSSKPLEVMLDSHGYSHIPANVKHRKDHECEAGAEESEIPKTTSSSDVTENISPNVDERPCMGTTEEHNTQSDMTSENLEEKRSFSIESHDSGVSCPSSYQTSTADEQAHRNKESFDSAISYSEIRVSIPEAIVVTDSGNSGFTRSFSQPDSMCFNEPKNERSNSEPTKTVACETGYANMESEYEDLDKYRKDLKKFLGMSDKPPEEVPPSLPERPASLPPSRKVLTVPKRKRVSFTAFGNNRSSSSSSDSEDAEHEIATIASWPIGQNTGSNALYASVERNANVVETKTSEYDQNLYETIPAAVEEEHNESPISSIKTWPLNRTAKANCNRFYESNVSIQTPAFPSETEVTDSKPLSKKDQDDISRDFLTGEAPHISSKVLPVLNPTKQAPVVDLLSEDIPDQSKKLPVLDVMLPFGFEEIKNSQLGTGMSQVKLRRPDGAENPFPNIARYSGAMESFAENSRNSTRRNSNNSDIVTTEEGNFQNKTEVDCVQEEKDLIDFGDTESSSDQKPDTEDVYIAMEEKEPIYVEPSLLQSSD